MDILIKNMKMPTEYPLWIVVSADGTVQYNYFNEWKTAEEKAIPVPPHGRLIDADALIRQMEQKMKETNNARYAWVDEMDISFADTIIEAEESE